MTTYPWIVGGDEILKRFTISRKARSGNNSSREWIMAGKLVRVFDEKSKAQAVADRNNRRY